MMMFNDRPKIKVPLETLDVIVELLNLTLLLLIVGYTAFVYSELSETIAIHFNAQGEPDRFGDRHMVWIIPVTAIVIYCLMLIVNKYPHVHNYMVNITEENALKNYRLSTRIVRFTNLFCQILFAMITFDIIQGGLGHDFTLLGIPFLVITVVTPLIGLGLIFYYQKKINS